MAGSPGPRLMPPSRWRASTPAASIASTGVEQFKGGPVGIEAVAAAINDEAETLAELVEPYLLKIGFVVRGPSGRRATRAAFQHLGYLAEAPGEGPQQLPL